MPIHILPDEIASQIAAGEVIERPASVIKELVENSLDSKANQIQIRIQGSGQPWIWISDNGYGIPAEELALAVSRHATSKLETAADLFSIRTLGFRGEALASIASVSRMTITSGQAGAPSGAALLVEGGHILEQKPQASVGGTVIQVENLFYNVPARLKFLKKDSTEKQANDAFIQRYALAYPEVQFQVWQDQHPSLQTTGSGDRREALASLMGIDIGRQMLEVEYQDRDFRVVGFTSPLAITRSNRREMTFFVNGRWVQDSSLAAALMQAYHTYLMVGRYPVSFLFLTMPPEEVDVNVHPAKAEVRFKSQDQVFSVIQRAVRKALLVTNPIPSLSSVSWGGSPAGPVGNASTFSFETIGFESKPPLDQSAPQESPAAIQPLGVMPLLRLIGQVGKTYLVAEGPDGLYLIDQHAAHERVLYERYLHQRSDKIQSQQLLEPIAVHLSRTQANLLLQQLDVVNRMGYQIEVFGGQSFLVRAIPAMFEHLTPADALHVLVEDFEEDETPLQTEVEARLVARICKRAAIKGGQTLSPEEQQQLLADLQACTSPRTCPHGRPTMIHLSIDLLERQFGRRGAR